MTPFLLLSVLFTIIGYMTAMAPVKAAPGTEGSSI